MANRRKSTEAAFQFLFSSTLPKNILRQDVFETGSLEEFCVSFGFEPDSYAKMIVEGVFQNANEIDEKIAQISTNWRIQRMPKVDITLIRMASFEVSYGEKLPKNVAINEAIELAKKFGSEESAAFVNGVLDRLAANS